MSAAPASPPRQESERPERSRNAKAQARHRAKRKAYIEELEETVTKLQTALGQFTYDQAAVLPPPLEKIRQLEQENARLLKQNDELHHMLADLGRRPPMPLSFDGGPNANGRRSCDEDPDSAGGAGREYKRRRMDSPVDSGPYIVQSRPGSSHAQHHTVHGHHGPPPPLTVPDRDPHPHPHHHYPHHTSVFGVLDPNITGPSGNANPSGSGGSGGGPALHLPDAPPPRSASYDRDPGGYDRGGNGNDRLSSTPTPDSAASAGGFTLPPFKFNALPMSMPMPMPEGHAHAHAQHDAGAAGSWRAYGDSERGA